MNIKYEKIIKEIISPNKNPQPTDRLTNSRLVDEIIKKFVEELERSPDQLKVVLFPTDFDIILHPDDYEEINAYFRGWIVPLVNLFYNIIKEKKKEFDNEYKTSLVNIFSDIFKDKGTKNEINSSIPPMREWRFCFDPCYEFFYAKDKPALTVSRGNVYIINATPTIGHVVTKSVNSKIRGTVNKDGKYETVDIDISGFTSLDKYTFKLPFNNDLRHHTASDVIFKSSFHAFHAVLRNMRGKRFEMRTSLIKISGSKETNKSDEVFIVDDDTLGTPHVAIRHKAEDGFEIAAFGAVSYNDAISGNHIFANGEISNFNYAPDDWHWEPLKDRSRIIMNNRTKVEFEVVRN